jgi:hypothetical protein
MVAVLLLSRPVLTEVRKRIDRKAQVNQLPVHGVGCIVTSNIFLLAVPGAPVDIEDGCSIVVAFVASRRNRTQE